jgi:hypothetical protein
MFMRRAAMMLALTLSLFLSVSPAHAQNEGDVDFHYQYMVDFWRENPPGTTLSDDPSENAPGYMWDTRVSRPKGLPAKEAALLERRLKFILDTVLAQPPLQDIKGTSLLAYLSLERDRFGMMYGSVSLFAPTIRIGDPNTKSVNGRYYTFENNGPELRIKLNSGLSWRSADRVRDLGTYNGANLAETGARPFLYVVNNGRTPIFADQFEYNDITYGKWNTDFYDRSLPPNKVQYLAGHIIHSARFEGLYEKTHPPTSNLGRLIAALYMVDWPATVRQLDAMK